MRSFALALALSVVSAQASEGLIGMDFAGPGSMLETGSAVETETEVVQQKYLEEAEQLEHGGSEQVKLQAAKAMQSLQYWLDHPEEHEKEVQRLQDIGKKHEEKKAAFVKQALEKGVVQFMGQKHHIMTKNPKMLEEEFDALVGGGELHPPAWKTAFQQMSKAKKPTAMLEVGQQSDEQQARDYNAISTALEAIEQATSEAERATLIKAAQEISQRELGEEQDQPISMEKLLQKAMKMEHEQKEKEAELLKEVEELSAERDSLMAAQEKGTEAPEYQKVLQQLDKKMAQLQKHQEVLSKFHKTAHKAQEQFKASQKLAKAGTSLLEEKEEASTQAVAQEESGKRLMLASEANEVLRSTSQLFKRSLKRWERANKDIVTVLLQDAKGPTPLQDRQVRDMAHRAQTAQMELHGLAGNDASMLEAAQHRMMSMVAKEAAALIEARGDVYPSLDKCTQPAAALSNKNLAMDSTCVCVTDQACSFIGQRSSKLCNYLAQSSCIGPEYMPQA